MRYTTHTDETTTQLITILHDRRISVSQSTTSPAARSLSVSVLYSVHPSWTLKRLRLSRGSRIIPNEESLYGVRDVCENLLHHHQIHGVHDSADGIRRSQFHVASIVCLRCDTNDDDLVV